MFHKWTTFNDNLRKIESGSCETPALTRQCVGELRAANAKVGSQLHGVQVEINQQMHKLSKTSGESFESIFMAMNRIEL